jgi:hypothetical protein
MKCEICDEEVANSEALKAHMEREHPTGGGDNGDEELEAPDMLTQQEKGATIIPGKN